MSTQALHSPISIIGGGIGGLTLALELARRGIASHVFEQADDFSEIGAGLQLSPNAVRCLRALGLEEKIAALSGRPEKIIIHDGLTNEKLNEIPLGDIATARYGAPYFVIARQDLLALLLEALESEPLVTLTHSKKLIALSQVEGSVTAVMEDESRYESELLVGCDGIWSRVRYLIDRDATPSQTGFIAWRTMIDVDDAPALLSNADTNVWLGPDAHLVQYLVDGGRQVNLVAVTKGTALQRSWSDTLPVERLYERLRGWDKKLRASVMETKSWAAWPLMLLKPFKPWSKGRALLLGDAAHGIVPFLAQGAAMAIEDAAVLAELIETHGNDKDAIFKSYEQQRFRRCRRVLSKSMLQVQFYHPHGKLAAVRNAMLKTTPKSILLRQYDWLYKG